MSKLKNTGHLNRRNVLMGIGIGAASLSALKPARAGLLPTGRRSEKHDIVIIGMGMAGTAAALQARLDGAEVLVLDKMPAATTGGNSRLAGGMFITPPEDTAQAKQSYYDALVKQTQGRGNTDIFRLLMNHSAEGVAWMRDQGVKFNPMIPEPPFPVGTYIPTPGLFQGMPTALAALARPLHRARRQDRV